MSRAGWTFLTNHTHVLVCIARDPGIPMRTVAEQVGVTERAVQRIVGELVEGGYLERRREGRRNTYRLDLDRPLRHPVEQGTHLRELLDLLSTGTRPTPDGTPDTAPAPERDRPRRAATPGTPVSWTAGARPRRS